MTKTIAAAVAVGLLLSATNLEASNPKPGLDRPKAEPNRIMIVSDAKEASPTFVEFFFHFNGRLHQWWQEGGKKKIRGQWKIFASEHVRTVERSIHSDLDVIAVSQAEEEMIRVIKTALQKAVAEYLSGQPGQRPNQLIATLAVISAKELAVKSRIIVLRPEADLKLIGNAAAEAIIRLLVENSKSPPAFAPTDQNGR